MERARRRMKTKGVRKTRRWRRFQRGERKWMRKEQKTKKKLSLGSIREVDVPDAVQTQRIHYMCLLFRYTTRFDVDRPVSSAEHGKNSARFIGRFCSFPFGRTLLLRPATFRLSANEKRAELIALIDELLALVDEFFPTPRDGSASGIFRMWVMEMQWKMTPLLGILERGNSPNA